MTGFARWTLAVVVLAALIHLSAVYFLPNFIVGQVHSQAASAVGTNTIIHSDRVDATSRQVVRPSPDLLYSLCAFDLGKGPVRFTMPVPQGTYSSVSFFHANSDNFFALNDRTVNGDRFDLVLTTDPDSTAPQGTERVVLAPGPKGIALFRTLITDEESFPRIDAARREADCVTVGE